MPHQAGLMIKQEATIPCLSTSTKKVPVAAPGHIIQRSRIVQTKTIFLNFSYAPATRSSSTTFTSAQAQAFAAKFANVLKRDVAKKRRCATKTKTRNGARAGAKMDAFVSSLEGCVTALAGLHKKLERNSVASSGCKGTDSKAPRGIRFASLLRTAAAREKRELYKRFTA